MQKNERTKKKVSDALEHESTRRCADDQHTFVVVVTTKDKTRRRLCQHEFVDHCAVQVHSNFTALHGNNNCAQVARSVPRVVGAVKCVRSSECGVVSG